MKNVEIRVGRTRKRLNTRVGRGGRTRQESERLHTRVGLSITRFTHSVITCVITRKSHLISFQSHTPGLPPPTGLPPPGPPPVGWNPEVKGGDPDVAVEAEVKPGSR